MDAAFDPASDPARAERILRQHLLTDHLLGVSRVPRGQPAPAMPPPPAARSAPPAPQGPQGPPTSPPTAPPSPPRSASPPPAQDEAQAPAEAEAPAEAIPEPDSPDRKLRLLEEMEAHEVRGCTKCDLCRSRAHTVFGEGDPDAAIMFIGEGPGQSEDQQARPFVGPAGELLDKMIAGGMGLGRERVYITNVVKCRPPNNRAPGDAEAQACWGYLRRQIAWVRPGVIVTLGASATKRVLNTKAGITRLRGTWHTYHEGESAIPVMPTFHPSYLLRSYTRENRLKVWSDLKAVRQRAGDGGA